MPVPLPAWLLHCDSTGEISRKWESVVVRIRRRETIVGWDRKLTERENQARGAAHASQGPTGLARKRNTPSGAGKVPRRRSRAGWKWKDGPGSTPNANPPPYARSSPITCASLAQHYLDTDEAMSNATVIDIVLRGDIVVVISMAFNPGVELLPTRNAQAGDRLDVLATKCFERLHQL